MRAINVRIQIRARAALELEGKSCGFRNDRHTWSFRSSLMFSAICHPEALLLREGSPGMRHTETPFQVLPHGRKFFRESQDRAFKDERSSEVLRPKEGLQDDRFYRTLNSVPNSKSNCSRHG